jgi:hypothetical protein
LASHVVLEPYYVQSFSLPHKDRSYAYQEEFSGTVPF